MPMVSKFNDDLIQPVQSWLWCQFIMKIFLWNRYCFPCGSDGKETACNAGDPGSSPGSGRSPREGNGNPLWYSCLENPIDRGAWWTTVHGVTKSWTPLSGNYYHSVGQVLHPSFIKSPWSCSALLPIHLPTELLTSLLCLMSCTFSCHPSSTLSQVSIYILYFS